MTNSIRDEVRLAINTKYGGELLDAIYKYAGISVQKTSLGYVKIKSIFTDADKTPSMYVNTDKGIWNCFSSGLGGGYIELIYRIRLHNGEDVKYKDIISSIYNSDLELQKRFKYKTYNSMIEKEQEIKVDISSVSLRVKNIYKETENKANVVKQIKNAIVSKDSSSLSYIINSIQVGEEIKSKNLLEIEEVNNKLESIDEVLKGIFGE